MIDIGAKNELISIILYYTLSIISLIFVKKKAKVMPTGVYYFGVYWGVRFTNSIVLFLDPTITELCTIIVIYGQF